MEAATRCRLWDIEPCFDLAGAATACDPAKIVFDLSAGQGPVREQGAETTGRNASRRGAFAMCAAACRLARVPKEAVDKLHAIAAVIAKAPIASVAVDL